MAILQPVQIIAVLLTGLIAGLLYGYDCSVVKGLGQLPDKEYLQAFQSINRVILNPYFALSFAGSLLALILAALLSFKSAQFVSFYWLIAATIVYVAGVQGVTIWGNVPLNNFLEKIDLIACSEIECKKMRELFEWKWNLLHRIRTIASMLAFLLTILSIVKKS
jgi:uncharacterized membrane protein